MAWSDLSRRWHLTAGGRLGARDRDADKLLPTEMRAHRRAAARQHTREARCNGDRRRRDPRGGIRGLLESADVVPNLLLLVPPGGAARRRKGELLENTPSTSILESAPARLRRGDRYATGALLHPLYRGAGGLRRGGCPAARRDEGCPIARSQQQQAAGSRKTMSRRSAWSPKESTTYRRADDEDDEMSTEVLQITMAWERKRKQAEADLRDQLNEA